MANITDAQRQAVLDYLQACELIATLSYNDTAVEWLAKYEDLYANNGKCDYSFSVNGVVYLFRFHANIVTQTLFYDIIDYSGNYIQTFQKLVEFPNTLLNTSGFKGVGLYFFENKLYLDSDTGE